MTRPPRRATRKTCQAWRSAGTLCSPACTASFLTAGATLANCRIWLSRFSTDIEDSRDELPEAAREDGLPTCISFDEGNNISAFAICVFGRSNIARAREWVGSFFIPGVLPLLIDRLRGENEAASVRRRC